MPINPDDFIKIAESINNTANNEIEYRVAASRAYYGAYHACSVLASGLGYSPSNSKTNSYGHAELCSLLKLHGTRSKSFFMQRLTQKDKKIRKIGHMLEQCKDLRATADYEIGLPFDKNKSSDAITYSREILKNSKLLP